MQQECDTVHAQVMGQNLWLWRRVRYPTDWYNEVHSMKGVENDDGNSLTGWIFYLAYKSVIQLLSWGEVLILHYVLCGGLLDR